MNFSHLKQLEAEAIEIIWTAYNSLENIAMLYSIGKDSSVMLHLMKKAFYPGKIPFPIVHVDTGWKFKEMIAFRDRIAKENNLDLIVYQNEEGLRMNVGPFTHGSAKHTDIMKTQALRQVLTKYRFDGVFGGGRRDEEKSRAKERIFSFRNENHMWDPKNQRPELWNIYNTKLNKNESFRVFPISNWSEIDIWLYIMQENIEIVPLYFAKEREVFNYNGAIIMKDDDRVPKQYQETVTKKMVRFRTLGCYPLTGAIESTASNLEEIINEMLNSKYSERQGRLIDSDGSASMEKKKIEGYF